MKPKLKLILPVLILLGAIAFSAVWLSKQNFPVLHPSGTVAVKQLHLMILSAGIMALVVIPVFIMLFTIAWKYRAGNKKPTKYQPDWDHNRSIELIWWGIPLLIITILSVVTWTSSHQLDPYKPLSSNQNPVNIQIISLDWKWLFIYPDQKVASLNFMQIPVNRPVSLTITSDAPMNSFWLPALAGQIYAMTGMSTRLHIEGNKLGDYYGSSANISGQGFADMHFMARVSNQKDFESWVKTAQSSPQILDYASYNQLAKPSRPEKTETYVLATPDLYDTVVMKYMMGSHGGSHAEHAY